MSEIGSIFTGDNGFAPIGFTTCQLPNDQLFETWGRFAFSVAKISYANKNPQACETDHLSWDIGDIRLEQTFLCRGPESPWRHQRESTMDHRCLILARNYGRDVQTNETKGSSYKRDASSVGKSFDEQASYEQILTLYLPRDLFRKVALSSGKSHVRVLNSWQGTILANYLITLARELPSISREHLSELSEATCALVRACLARTFDSPGRSEKPSVTVLRERARRIVRQQMASAEFGPETLQRLVGMSRSKLYRIFESSGGVARFIQQERLSEARRRLADTQNKVPISALATEVGFSDHSSFSRAFKLEYGYSPSDAREIALANRLLELPEVR